MNTKRTGENSILAKGFTWTPLGKALAVTVAVLYAVVTSGCAAITKDHQVALNGVPINQLYADLGQVKTDANPNKQDKSWWKENWFFVVFGIIGLGVAIAGIAGAFEGGDGEEKAGPPGFSVSSHPPAPSRLLS